MRVSLMLLSDLAGETVYVYIHGFFVTKIRIKGIKKAFLLSDKLCRNISI